MAEGKHYRMPQTCGQTGNRSGASVRASGGAVGIWAVYLRKGESKLGKGRRKRDATSNHGGMCRPHLREG